jgi:hypothetical protein
VQIYLSTYVGIQSFNHLFHCIFLFSIAEKVHDTMHTAFWDVLREDLSAEPPRYEHVIKLIGEAKEVCFLI